MRAYTVNLFPLALAASVKIYTLWSRKLFSSLLFPKRLFFSLSRAQWIFYEFKGELCWVSKRQQITSIKFAIKCFYCNDMTWWLRLLHERIICQMPTQRYKWKKYKRHLRAWTYFTIKFDTLPSHYCCVCVCHGVTTTCSQQTIIYTFRSNFVLIKTWSMGQLAWYFFSQILTFLHLEAPRLS